MGKSEEYEVEQKPDDGVVKILSCRVMMAILSFFGAFTIYLMRVNLSLSILCMTEDNSDNTTNTTDTSFNWSKEQQGYILSSFFWGYILTQVPGGMMSRRWGAKWVVAGGLVVAVIATLISAPLAYAGAGWLALARIINGLGQGVFFPSIYNMWAFWAPPEERSQLITAGSSGIPISNIVTFIMTGIICDTIGWEWTFYLYGIVGIFYILWWCLCFYDSPDLHPRIKESERIFINDSLTENKEKSEKKVPVPWKPISCSWPTMALYVCAFCSGWGGYVNLTCLPQYFQDVLGFDITENGFANALPHASNFIFTLLFAQLADCLIAKKMMSMTAMRKLMETLGYLPSAACFIMAGYVDESQPGLAILLICLAEGLHAATRSGHSANHVDVCGRFSGVVMGVSNTIGNIPGGVAPIVVAAITKDGTREQWQVVFWMSGVMYIIAWFCFMFMASGELQWWALEPDDDLVLEVTMDGMPDGDGIDNMALKNEKLPEKESAIDKASPAVYEDIDIEKDIQDKRQEAPTEQYKKFSVE